MCTKEKARNMSVKFQKKARLLLADFRAENSYDYDQTDMAEWHYEGLQGTKDMEMDEVLDELLYCLGIEDGMLDEEEVSDEEFFNLIETEFTKRVGTL